MTWDCPFCGVRVPETVGEAVAHVCARVVGPHGQTDGIETPREPMEAPPPMPG